MDSKEKIQKTTLGKLGFTLPVGVKDEQGALQKEFAFKKWRLKEEKELGELKKEMENASITKYVSAVLSTMCTKIGPHDFTAMDETHKKLALYQMEAADIFYIYTKLRVDNIGKEIDFGEFVCPYCAKKLTFKGDLNTIDVSCVNEAKDLIWEYELKEPIEIRGELTKTLKLNTVKWNAYEMLKEDHINEGVAGEYFILNSIIGSDIVPSNLLLVDGELDELGKADFDILVQKISENTPGPSMSIETSCTRVGCKKDIFVRIPWEKESFFGTSSQ